MDAKNIRNVDISKIFIYFGIVIFIISSIDLIDITLPLRLASPEWLFGTTQNIIASVLAPALSLVLVLTGLYFITNSSTNKKLLGFEKTIGLISFIFGFILILNLLVYSLSMKAYETSVLSSVKLQKETTLDKLNRLKNTPELNISEELYNKKVAELNNAETQQIKIVKNGLFKKNVKIIIELLLYIGLYLGIGKISFDSSKTNLLKLKFNNNN